MAFKTSTCERDEKKVPSFGALEDFSNVATQYGTAFSAVSCFTKEVMEPMELPAGRSVLDVFGLCFDDDTPMLTEYHKQRGDTNQKTEHWRASTNAAPFCGQRQFTCTTLVRAMMNKPYDFIEYQRYALFKVNDVLTLAVQFTSQVPGVMFGDAFRAESLAVFTQSGTGDDAKVTMRAYGYVQFLRGVLVKGKINSTSLNQELPASYKIMSGLVAKILAEKGDPVVVVEEKKVEEEVAPPQPPQVEAPPSTVKQQTIRLHQSLVYGTLCTLLCVLVASFKGLMQALFVPCETSLMSHYRVALVIIYIVALSGSIGVTARVLAVL